MDRFWTFVQAMTIWNWLTLIAFIFFPLSALNAFFSLKSRYRDWRGIQSKKNFKQRLKQLEKELSRVQAYQMNRPKLFTYALNYILIIMGLGLLGLFFFMTGLFLHIAPISNTFFDGMLFAMSITPIVIAFIIVLKVARLVNMVYDPNVLVKELLKFFENGLQKGFILDPTGTVLAELKSRIMPTNEISTD